MAGEYTEGFYGVIAQGCIDSAGVVVPLILEGYGHRPGQSERLSVVDVGSGQGWWGAEFAKHGCEVLGIDGGYVPDRQIPFHEADLEQPFGNGLRVFDIAVCLEVAEHLPESRAASFVADLCRLSEFVVFSAAIPHQGGAGHVNLQWPSYWAGLFAEHGYRCDGNLRWRIWTDERVEAWYRNNLLIFSPSVVGDEPPIDCVHPVLHEWGR